MTDPRDSQARGTTAETSTTAGTNLTGRLGRGFGVASLVMLGLLYLLRPG